MSRKASVHCRQPALLASAVDTSLQLLHPASHPCCPGSTPLSRPFWCPCHCSPTVIIISFPDNVSDEIPSTPSEILAEVFHLGHLQYFFVGDSVKDTLAGDSTYKILKSTCLRHLFWKTSILFSSLLFIFHVSQPYCFNQSLL